MLGNDAGLIKESRHVYMDVDSGLETKEDQRRYNADPLELLN